MTQNIVRSLCWASAPLIAIFAAPVAAQSSETPVSRAVVQPLPPEGVADLNSALRRLARNSNDLGALIDAGTASLDLNDVDAAIGFFGRADEVSPGNPRAKAGLAAAFVRSERPIEALRLFEEAERGGASTLALSADRGLAYDLVGNHAQAQEEYRKALATRSSDDLLRRLALSQAIAGDRDAFEKTLYPLLAKRDFAAYRARAFGLAILGQEDEAVAIAEAVMPREMSSRIAPYLRYMRRLTPAQQAAASNLGIFPRAAEIGRDDPQIAAYSGSSSAVRGADARLAPAGQPLGATQRPDTSSPRRRPDRGTSSVANSQGSGESRAARAARADRRAASDPLARSRAPERIRVASGEPATAPVSAPVTAQAVTPPVETPVRIARSAPPPVTVETGTSGELAPVRTAENTVATVSRPVVQSTPEPVASPPPPAATPTVTAGAAPEPVVIAGEATAGPKPVVVANATTTTPRPGFDLAQVPPSSAVAPAATVQAIPTPASTPAPVSASVADAFAGFTLPPSQPAVNATGAVDITAIKPPREVEKKEEAKPAAPANPSRQWVQLATGRDRSALKFDWRRFSKKAADILGDFNPHVTQWNETNRLLAGPYVSAKAAREAMNALKEAGIDTFTYTSPEGQEVDELK